MRLVVFVVLLPAAALGDEIASSDSILSSHVSGTVCPGAEVAGAGVVGVLTACGALRGLSGLLGLELGEQASLK